MKGPDPTPSDADEIARTLLDAVNQRPEDEAAHEAFLEYCARTGQVAFAARAYRDKLARHQPKWEAIVATAALSRHETTPPYRTSIALAATLLVLVGLLAALPMCMRGKLRATTPSSSNRRAR